MESGMSPDVEETIIHESISFLTKCSLDMYLLMYSASAEVHRIWRA